MTLDPQRQQAAIAAAKSVVEAAVLIDAEALQSWIDLVESPIGKTLLPVILQKELGDRVPEPMKLAEEIMRGAKLTLFYVVELKKIYGI